MAKKENNSPTSFRKLTKNAHRKEPASYQSKTPQDRRRKQAEIGDIKDQLRNFARTEWGRRWVNSILEYGRPFRMQRGLRYAQEERISNLTITSGLIFASVQGTAPMPYRVKIHFDPIPKRGWEGIINLIAEKARYIIRLLENKMPPDVEEIFNEKGFPLYPSPNRTLNATCSCPDKAVPCKHIAATTLYVARVMDFDPFLILKLRGMDKDEILQQLQTVRSCSQQPIAKSIKKLHEMIDFSEDSFDFPSITAEDIQEIPFSKSEESMQIGFKFSQPKNVIETLDNIGIAPNLEQPDSFQLILRDIYLGITKKMYQTAVALETKPKMKREKKSRKKEN